MKHVLLLSFLCCSLVARSQKDVGGFLHAAVGLSVPQAEFATSSADVPASGYAKNGLAIYGLLGHKIKKGFGLFGMLMLSANAMDDKAMTRELERISPAYTWQKNRSIWTVGGLNFGPHYSFNFERWALDGRLMAGALNFISPEIKLTGISRDGSGSLANITQFYTKSSSWAWGGGITAKYEFRYGWVLLLNTDYLAGNPKFTGVRTLTEIPSLGINEEQQLDYTQKFRMLMFTSGVGIVF
jgi:hypothetical protein